MRRHHPFLPALAGAFATCLAAPGVASAHGVAAREDLPLPMWLFGWAATGVLVISFVALAAFWPSPRLEYARERTRAQVPRPLEAIPGAIGVALFGLVVWAGLAGEQSLRDNIAPTLVYVYFWVGLPILSLLLGDVFAALSPWRAAARALAWIGRRAAPGRAWSIRPYPERLGVWPAVAGLFAFAWVELVYAGGDDPSTLAVLALAYAAIQLAGMARYGIDAWTAHGDAFAVYFGLFARLSPLRWSAGRIFTRPPLSGALRMPTAPGVVALVAVAIGTTGFDGFSASETWADATELADTLAMVILVGLLGGLFWLGILGVRTIDRSRTPTELARRFVPSLVPIALAYVVAHYFSLLALEGQGIAGLVSDPLGRGWNLFGTADAGIDYGAVSTDVIWYVQVFALVVGHVAGLLLAHDRALLVFRDARRAIRSQYWMLAVMVAFTTLGLLLLSSAGD